jgi:hypothetical protein
MQRRRGRILGLVFALCSAAAGCGGDEGGATDGFVGTWNYTSGTSTSDCTGQPTTMMLTGSTTISKGISSPLVVVDDGCTLLLDVTGTTASARPSQQCSETSQGVNTTLKFKAYSFTVNGIVADESGSADVAVTGPGGAINCTYTSTGKLMKVSK